MSTSFLPKISRRSLSVAGLALGLLIVLGLFWFAISRDSPSKVLVSTIMKANAANYSGAEECLLPETLTALESWIMTRLMWDRLTKNGTIKSIKVLNEEVRGEGAAVSISIAYRDGTSCQIDDTLSKLHGKWKVSLMGPMQTDLWGLSAPSQNSKGELAPESYKPATGQASTPPSRPGASDKSLRPPPAGVVGARSQPGTVKGTDPADPPRNQRPCPLALRGKPCCPGR